MGVKGGVVHRPLAHAPLHGGELVARVADREAARQPGGAVLLLQQPQAEAVEGRDEDVHPRRAGHRRDPLAHLPRRLVGEGDGEDRLGVHPAVEQQIGRAHV